MASLALTACGKAEQSESAQARARSVTVVRIAERPMSGALSATGQLAPREEAAVSAEVGGYRVARVLVEQGAHVRAGQTLAVLDGTLLNAQIDQQAAVAAQADAAAAQAEAEAARVAGLDGQGVLSQEAIEQRRATAKAQRAAANAQAAGLRDLQTRRRKLAVTAPVSGLVLSRAVRPGDTSAVGGGEPWFRMARDGLIELEAQMSQEDLDRVQVGQPAQVVLPNGVTVEGQVRLVSPNVDPQTKLGAVRVRLPVRPDIRAGGFGRAEFANVAGQGLTLPETAVRYDAGGAAVMTLTADNKIKRVPVKTGQRGSGLVQILQGPPAGTRVVKSAGAFLLDGDLVRPVEEGAAAPAAKPAPAVKPAPGPAVKG